MKEEITLKDSSSNGKRTTVKTVAAFGLYIIIYSFATPIARLYSFIFSTVIHIGFSSSLKLS